MPLVVVVPCFNEAARLDGAGFLPLYEAGHRVLFVDDGSTDDTRRVLERLCADAPAGSASLLALAQNGGKAAAVHAGLRRALDDGAGTTGYLDADLATPAEELLRLHQTLLDRGADAVIGARVALLGSDIRRHATRHYLGRVFATAVSLTLGAAVYDTQCGAKVFRAGPALRAALAEPFVSSWSFDVELIGRLLGAGANVIEVPLRSWRDVGGSKLGVPAMLRATIDLIKIRAALKRR